MIDVYINPLDTDKKLEYKRRRNQASNFTEHLLVRLFIFNRDGNKCRQCGSPIKLTIDHVISVYRNGDNSWENLQTLCNHCNSSKAP